MATINILCGLVVLVDLLLVVEQKTKQDNKNTKNTDGQNNEIQRKNKENNYSRPKFST